MSGGQASATFTVPAGQAASVGYYVVGVYNGGTDGTDTWQTSTSAPSLFNVNQLLAISGGTNTQVGGNKVVTFTSSGTVTVSSNGTAQVLVVGGGGGGGTSNSGGGGGGGVVYNSAFPLSIGTYSVVVGAGGAGGSGSVTDGNLAPIPVSVSSHL